MDFNEVAEALRKATFRPAKTMPENPHSYSLIDNWQSFDHFREVVRYIQKYGTRKNFYSKIYSYLEVDGYEYWTMGLKPEDTTLINKAKLDLKRLFEAGHYYEAHGITDMSRIGWEIARKMKGPQDSLMLFIDDVHTKDQIADSEFEETELIESYDFPDSTYTVYESEVEQKGREALEKLQKLSKKKKARQSKNGDWYCGGSRLTKGDKITCVLYDVGLTMKKSEMGYDQLTTILPYYYEEHQAQYSRLVSRLGIDIIHAIILFKDGNDYWTLR